MNHPLILKAALFCLILFSTLAVCSAQDTNSLSAGTAKVSINPEQFPVIVNGGFLSGQANSIVSPVFVRALVLDNGSCRIAMATIDVCILDTGLCHSIRNEAAQQTGIPADHIVVMATHTHSGGSVVGALGTPADETYTELVRQRTIETIVQAASNPVPVKIGWKAMNFPEGTHCRVWITRPDKMQTDPFGDKTVRAMMHPGYQNPDYIGPCGPVNCQLSVISLQTLDGKPFAVFANYPMHYFGAGAISPDYFGLFCNILEERLGIDSSRESSGLVLHSQGTSGDLHWMDYNKPPVSIGINDYAAKLADVAMTLLADVQYHDWVPLDAKQVIPTFDRRRPDEFRLAWAREKVRELDHILPKDRPEVYAYEAIFLDADPKRDVPLQAIRIGDVGIAAIPCEIYAITGLKLAQCSPFEMQITLELANGGEGYIPPPEIHPFGGYNTWPARSAALVATAETEIVEISLGLLEDLAEQKRKTPVPLQTTYSDTVLGDKPFVFWRMNNIDGKTCPDSSANAKQPGTYQPCVAYWLDGPEFAGKNGETVMIPAAHFAGGCLEGKLEGLPVDYSFETWIWNGLDPETRLVTGYIFSRDPSTAKSLVGDHLGIGGTHEDGKTKGRLFLYNGNDGKSILVGQTEIPLKEWIHVVMTREGDKVSLYINGKLDAQGDIARTFDYSEPSVVVGNRSDRFAGFEGKMAETAFYDRVLSAKEIENHWKSALGR
ncbi:MAG: LamG domain-containing protein [Planctomycetaceae bacterium]|nr:LamG domain-containing protein [Planctomycetaceae bacterium]